MALDDSIREKISLEVIKTLVKKFLDFPEDAKNNRNAPFHEAFLEAFAKKFSKIFTNKKDNYFNIPIFISLSSWLQGLNTTIGQTFFEKTAHILSGGIKQQHTKKRSILKITEKQRDNINDIITELSNTSSRHSNLQQENNKLYLKNDNSKLVDSIGFVADVFIEDDKNIFAIELKSVKPNSGEMRGEKLKILNGKAALYRKYPNKKIHFYLGFPFDPTTKDKSKPDSSNKEIFVSSCINMKKYFANDEILLANELWDFLSGQKNTMNQILSIIRGIATVEFSKKWDLLNETSEWGTEKYLTILTEWNLKTEIKIIKNKSLIEKKANNRQIKLLKKKIFNEKGTYDWARACELIGLIKECP